MTIIAQTNRLIIREFLSEELETYLNHFTDDRVLQYIPKRSRDERIGFFTNALKQYHETKYTGIWGIFNKADSSFIGSCLLRDFELAPNTVEIGYSLDHKYWGQGYASEMVIATVAHGFTDARVDEIVAVTVLENISSQRVLEKAGLKQVDNIIRNGMELAYFRLKRA